MLINTLPTALPPALPSTTPSSPSWHWCCSSASSSGPEPTRRLARRWTTARRRSPRNLNDAKRLREEAEALLAEYKQKRIDAEKEAGEIIARAKSDAALYAEEAKKKLS